MDHERAHELVDYWSEWPPVHVTARAFMGGKAKPTQATLEDVREIAAKIGGM